VPNCRGQTRRPCSHLQLRDRMLRCCSWMSVRKGRRCENISEEPISSFGTQSLPRTSAAPQKDPGTDRPCQDPNVPQSSRKGHGVPALQRSGGTSNKARLHRCAPAWGPTHSHTSAQSPKVPTRGSSARPASLLRHKGCWGSRRRNAKKKKHRVHDHPSQRHALPPLSCASSPWSWA